MTININPIEVKLLHKALNALYLQTIELAGENRAVLSDAAFQSILNSAKQYDNLKNKIKSQADEQIQTLETRR